ncbi:MAG: NAD(P)-dependent oxidoreductase [Methanomicrobiales archaeon]|nr:NAD(P)-dependent oxidoreductase [Methanomicrobiales archaeon]
MREPRVLIMGGSGFIGGHLIRKFSGMGTEATVFDIQPPASPLPEGITFVQGDAFNPKTLEKPIEACDAVVHLIGLADSGAAQMDPMRSFRLNVISLQNVLEMCRITGGKKIIFPSSAAVYGTTDDLPIKENFPLNPTNVYSWHKVICEEMIRGYQKNYGLSYVTLRLFNVYGRGNEGVIGIFIQKARNHEEIESFGPFQYRDFIYGADVADAVYRAVVYDKAMNRTINIGSGKGIQIREILEMVMELFPQARWREVKTSFTMYDSIADITLARILLDFEPRSSREFLAQIIQEEMI